MKLSDAVRREPNAAEELRDMIDRGQLPGVTFRQAMEFLLSDGVLPEDELPLASFLRLEEWARERLRRQAR